MLGVGALAAAWISYGRVTHRNLRVFNSHATGTYIGFDPTNNGQWRTSLGIQIIPAIFLAALILVFPESPRWLVSATYRVTVRVLKLAD